MAYYSDLLNNQAIDAVYIPLPAGLHYEWALKALSKGKHVLIEKPAVVNATEAELLFRSPLLGQPTAPVLLEAMHFRFQPAWQYFLGQVDGPRVKTAEAVARLPSYIIPAGGIRFDFEMGGGNMLDLGTYPMNALRHIMGTEPEECTVCTIKPAPPPNQLCDEFAKATFRFPGGRTGTATMDMRAPITTFPTFDLMVSHHEVKLEDTNISKGQAKFMTITLSMRNFLMSSFWHQIDILHEFRIRDETNGKLIKQWATKETKKIYTFEDAGIKCESQAYWTSYRHQLEQFVNRVRGSEGSGLWVSNEDSLAQAKMIDMAYRQSGLPVRPSACKVRNDN